MIKSTRMRLSDARGVALAELALVLPLLLVLLLGMLDFGKAFNDWIDETHLANEGAGLADESGAVISIVAIALVGLILMVAFVVDVANWKVHKRHLQVQADAAALAAAHSFSFGSCSDATIIADAHRYGGPDASGATAL